MSNFDLMNGPGIITPKRQDAELPELEHEEQTKKGEGWIVTVFDNDTNTQQEVMRILMLATGCTSEEAYIEMWEIHHYNKCIVHRASQKECERAADVIATIGIKVEVTLED